MTTPCSCTKPFTGGDEAPLERLAVIRSECPVLREVLLPDEAWPEFKTWHSQLDTIGFHRSMVLLALERGHLDRITSPIHRYLIDGGSLRPNVRHQYLKDLRERWMHCVDPIERHRKSRIFHSRLAELQCAEWLEAQGWVIEGLEALREGPDIEAASAEGAAAAFEVKLIGTEDVDFEMILRNIAGEAAGGPVSAYSGINYLLFRVYEAAKQLAGINSRRIAVVIVEDLTWWRFELQLKNGGLTGPARSLSAKIQLGRPF